MMRMIDRYTDDISDRIERLKFFTRMENWLERHPVLMRIIRTVLDVLYVAFSAAITALSLLVLFILVYGYFQGYTFFAQDVFAVITNVFALCFGIHNLKLFFM